MSATVSNNSRVSVNLRMLVDMAKHASALALRPKQIKAVQSGNYVSHFKGRGMAFSETRLYQPGDDVRRIDWRVTARTDKPHSKVFCEERERPLFISVDYRPSMAFATRGVFKFVQAAKLAALLAWAAQQQSDRIGGQIFGAEGCQELKPRTGKAALLRFLNALAKPEFSDTGNNTLETALSRLRHHAHPGSRVYIISDFRGLDDATDTHLALLSRHCEVVLLHIYDVLETQLPAQGRFRFTDKIREVLFDSSDSQQQRQYQRRFQQRQAHLQLLSQKFKLRYLAFSTQDTPQNLLTSLNL
jgi:uncharacterized protein (DUF58 family)